MGAILLQTTNYKLQPNMIKQAVHQNNSDAGTAQLSHFPGFYEA